MTMSATLTAIRPTRLDIVDLPRDKERCLGGLRNALCATFNYVKHYPAKLAVLVEVLEYVLERAKELNTGAVEAALEAKEAARVAADLAEQEAADAARKELVSNGVKQLKESAKGVIETAQNITVLEELKEFIVTSSYTPVGETVQEIVENFVKAKTADTLALIAEYKQSFE
jgi:hypothetical protein